MFCETIVKGDISLMVNEIKAQFKGTIVKDATLYTPPSGGRRSLQFTVAHSARKKRNDVWEDMATMFIDCTVWDRFDGGDLYLDGLFDVLKKGRQVLVNGGLYAEGWTSRDGSKSGTSTRCMVDAVGVLAEWAFVQVQPHPRKDQQQSGAGWAQGGGQQGWAQSAQSQQPQAQSWAQPQQAQQAWVQPQTQPAAQPPAQAQPHPQPQQPAPAQPQQPQQPQQAQPQVTWGEQGAEADGFDPKPF